MERLFNLLKRHQNGYRTLFDPSGLRTSIKIDIVKYYDEKKEKTLPYITGILKDRNTKCAVALDEELPFIFLNGYTAYRFGYRCYMISSKSEMFEVLNSESKRIINLSFEDKELRFHDMIDIEEMNKINDLKERAELLNKLSEETGIKRFIVTGVLSSDKINGFLIIHKPYSGLYHLGKKSDIYNSSNKKITSQEYLSFESQRNYSDKQFKLENNNTGKELTNDTMKEHPNAINRILLIANLMLNRARNISKQAITSEMAVHSALLALEAKELLHGRSITTVLEAISIQHQAEVMAECSFYGVTHDIETDLRFAGIAEEVDDTIDISSKEKRKLAQSYNAQIETINNLRHIFKDYEQFDEEESCLDKVRELRQGLHFYSSFNPSRRIKALGSMFVEKYFNWLLVSKGKWNIPWNIVKSIGYIVIFCMVFYWIVLMVGMGKSYEITFLCKEPLCPYTHSHHKNYTLTCMWVTADSFLQSFLTFFEMQPAGIIKLKELENQSSFWYYFFNGILALELIAAYFHLGIFITYLYQKLSRR